MTPTHMHLIGDALHRIHETYKHQTTISYGAHDATINTATPASPNEMRVLDAALSPLESEGFTINMRPTLSYRTIISLRPPDPTPEEPTPRAKKPRKRRPSKPKRPNSANTP